MSWRVLSGDVACVDWKIAARSSVDVEKRIFTVLWIVD